MNYLLENPKGIDVEVQAIQNKLYKSLESSWLELDGYGRVQKAISEDGANPEFFISGVDYLDIYPGEKSKFFFLKGDSHIEERYTGIVTSELGLYVFVNIAKLNTAERYDEKALIDVMTVIESTRFKPEKIQGVEAFLSDFKKMYDSSEHNPGNIDLQPFHVFKVKGYIEYKLKKTC